MENEKHSYCVYKNGQCPEMYTNKKEALGRAKRYIGCKYGFVEVWDMVKGELIYYWCY